MANLQKHYLLNCKCILAHQNDIMLNGPSPESCTIVACQFLCKALPLPNSYVKRYTKCQWLNSYVKRYTKWQNPTKLLWKYYKIINAIKIGQSPKNHHFLKCKCILAHQNDIMLNGLSSESCRIVACQFLCKAFQWLNSYVRRYTK